MYDTALPDETLRRIREMSPAAIVVGITSYRNPDTIEDVVRQAGDGLARFFRHLNPVLINVDGHSGDDTLERARTTGAPGPVRHILTRYQGLPGRGSAARAIFEIATHLDARAVVLLEADVTTLQKQWLPTLVGPVLAQEVDAVLPRYESVSPPSFINDWIAAPLFEAVFGVNLRHLTPGQVAMTGDVAAYFARSDVWETDIARSGLDIWMTGEIVLSDDISAGEVALAHKAHTSIEFSSRGDAKFLQEVSTLFRIVYHYRHHWQMTVTPPSVRRLNLRAGSTTEPAPINLPDEQLRERFKAAMKDSTLQREWHHAMSGEQYDELEHLLAEEEPSCSAVEWSRFVYDFVTVYHKGDGDPDNVVAALYPLFLARCITIAPAITNADSYDTLRQEQHTAFTQTLPYLHTRWRTFVPQYQTELSRQLRQT